MDKNILASAAKRASARKFFLGHVISIYAKKFKLTKDEIAKRLGCSKDALPRLFLCRCPKSEDSSFIEDIQRIAEFVGADSISLLKLLREAEAISALVRSEDLSGKNQGYLAAARDREEISEQEQGENDKNTDQESQEP
jgi:hypothetical protein